MVKFVFFTGFSLLFVSGFFVLVFLFGIEILGFSLLMSVSKFLGLEFFFLMVLIVMSGVLLIIFSMLCFSFFSKSMINSFIL